MKRKFNIPGKIILVNAMFMFCCFALNAQTVYTQNFGTAGIPALPSGWVTTTVYSLGWATDSSNASTGYAGSSGSNNVVIRNDGDSTGTYTLTSAPVSTLNYKDITILFGTRVTVHFLESGSTYPTLEYSSNGGTAWNALTYTDNDTNSTWALVNSGNRIALPADANDKADVRFRWTIHIVHSTSGTYRIDDFNVKGTIINGIAESSSESGMVLFPNPVNDVLTITSTRNKIEGNYETSVFDMLGRNVMHHIASAMPVSFSCKDLVPGMYFVKISSGDKLISEQRFIKN